MNRTIREGLIAGILGGSAVALWFFAVDMVTGQPFHTPRVLGESFLNVLGLWRGQGLVELLVLYTIWHFLVFVVVGVLAAWMLNASEREPSHLAGLFLLFAVFEVAFYLYVYALSWRGGRLVALPWYQIAAANLLAAVVMGRFLFRAHPNAMHNMNDALAGRT
jgi:hypothetical protein